MAKKTRSQAAGPAEGAPNSDSLFSSSKKVDPTLASLFASTTPVQPVTRLQLTSKANKTTSEAAESEDEDRDESVEDESSSESEIASDSSEDENSASLYSSGKELSIEEEERKPEPKQLQDKSSLESLEDTKAESRRKRKRNDEDLESKYMQRLAREEAREEAKRQDERQTKRQKASDEALSDDESVAGAEQDQDENMKDWESEDDDEEFEVPQHESLSTAQTPDVEKANRTVFLANVSVDAVTSKKAKKTLFKYMSTNLDDLPKEKAAHKIESIRFRSTAYTNMLPKKASFVTQDVMESTTRSTNAYIVYTTKTAAREALKLNGTIVLGRHVRVDSVAHPSKTDPRRCVFVGNLGFVDDESAVQAAEDEEGKKKRKPKKKEPSDIEEGLWREFGKCGTVDNVRVVRDSKTRVGKGFAYVQFTDENAVEAALLYDGKRFPPMLPRKLRVMRAKGIKRNASKKDTWSRPAANGVYNPKINAQQKSAIGRASKLLGRAGAALANRPGKAKGSLNTTVGLKAPESFVFEGHRATKDSHIGNKKRVSKKKGKPDNRSTRRATAWKVGGSEK